MAITRALVVLLLVACSAKSSEPAKPPPRTVRVAVIGGMIETGFLQQIATRFEQATGNKVELASSGPKPVVIGDFRKGGIDLILARAAAANAYTLVGRIPVLLGKLAQPGIEIMVRGDARLRRPYLVAVAHTADQPRLAAARELAAFLRSPATQQFIATFDRGRYDDQSLFFPIVVR